MIKYFLNAVVLFALILTVTSCSPSVFGAVGRGSIVDEPIAVTPFTSVVTSSSADVTITTGDSLQVILSDYENLIELWEVKVENNQLVIETKPFKSLVNSKAKVTIVMPATLKEVKIAGSGNIDLNSPFPLVEKCIISGSGNITGHAITNYTDLTLTISGSGSFNFVGTANRVKATTTGSGKMYLSNLVANDVRCLISGSGNMYVHAQNSLNATITGSGNIIYSGNPTVDVKTSGSGSVRHE